MTEPLPDPLEGIPLPYAVDLVATGTNKYDVPAGQRGGSPLSNRHDLGPGTYDVEITVDAPAGAALQLYKDSWSIVAEIPDADTSGPRSSDIVTINIPEGVSTSFLEARSGTPYPAADSGHSGAILISPIKKAGTP